MSSESELIIATCATPGTTTEIDALVLCKSLRTFGGRLADSSVLCMYPVAGKGFHSTWKKQMLEMDVELSPVHIENGQEKKWFVGHAIAAAKAEGMAKRKAKRLAWINPNTVIVNEPTGFLIPPERQLGYRPVHHALIGSRFSEPLDEYWALVYEICEVPEERAFSMKTHVEETRVRPYFNAGCLIVRPEVGILRKWSDLLQSVYDLPQLVEMYRDDQRHEIFIHQAILSGVILNMLETRQLIELSPLYNYPVHLHAEDITYDKPKQMDDTITFRHEGFYRQERWSASFPGSSHLMEFLSDSVKCYVDHE